MVHGHGIPELETDVHPPQTVRAQPRTDRSFTVAVVTLALPPHEPPARSAHGTSAFRPRTFDRYDRQWRRASEFGERTPPSARPLLRGRPELRTQSVAAPLPPTNFRAPLRQTDDPAAR
jgi:hypothetical protein